MLFGIPMHELSNRVLPLDDVLPPGVRGLAERLEDVTTWDERFDLVDAALVRRLSCSRPPSRDVAWAWAILERTGGRAPIGWICDRLGRSRRHLAARFREEIGLTPKTAARVLRFEQAVKPRREHDEPRRARVRVPLLRPGA
jgi:AraC-like DNA-binding protein